MFIWIPWTVLLCSDGNENKIKGNVESKGSNEIGYAKGGGSFGGKDVVGLKNPLYEQPESPSNL